jgi:thioester reductase-like protein
MHYIADVLAGLTSSGTVEEALIHDPSISVGAGYIESKWVAEHVLAAAADATRLKPTIIRLGQLTGGRKGFWKVTEWIPSMIKSGLSLGALPSRTNVCLIFFIVIRPSLTGDLCRL